MRTSLVAFFLLAPAGSASAYELVETECGAPLRFDRDTVEYDVVFTDPAFSAAARRAFDQWGMAMRGVLVPQYRGASEGARSVDERTTVELVTDFPFDGGETTIAYTALFYDCDSGVLYDADVFLNGENFRYAADTRGAIDPESAIVHEVGHVFGLGHTCGDPRTMYPSCFNLPAELADEILSAVMSPTLSSGTVRRALLPDDIAGIEARYPLISSETTVPKISNYSVVCPGDAQYLVAISDPPTSLSVHARLVDGSTTALGVNNMSANQIELAEPIPEGGDLMLVDPTTRAYASLVSPEKPTCEPKPEPEPPPPEESCACRGSRQSPASSWILFSMALLATLALRSRRAWPLLIACALALPAADAFAFKCSRIDADTGPSLYWMKREIPWLASTPLTTDMPNDVALEQLRLSFDAWEAIDCSDITLPFGGAQPGLKAGFENGGENQNVVVFLDNWPYDRGVIAVTTNAFDTRSGLILDSDIEINSQQFFFVVADNACDARQGQMDLRNAITHEVGHLLGLDHPPMTMRNQDVTMFASAPPCETKKRSLAPDDMMGICSIYPAGMEVHQCYPPDGPSFVVVENDDGFGGCSSVERSSVMLSWILVGAIVWLARKRRA